jgi:Fe-S oxidoreductase
MATFPRFFNFFLDAKLIKAGIRKTIGYVDAPLLSVPNLKKRVESLECEHDLKSVENLSASEKQDYVVVVQDPFTSFYDAQSVEKLIVVIKKLGLKPLLLPFSPNGKAQHVKGFLSRFENTAQNTAACLIKFMLWVCL